MKIVVIQGPNLNMLGVREQGIYGSMKLEDIHGQMKAYAEKNKTEIEFFQSNLEGEIVDRYGSAMRSQQACIMDNDKNIVLCAAHIEFKHVCLRLISGPQ